MLASKNKVGTDLFKRLLEKGRSYQSEDFSTKVFLGAGSEPARFSVVVPKKVLKSAVERNATKRRFYAALRPFLPLARPGVLCALFVKKKVDTQPFPALSLEIRTALEKAGVIVQR